MSSTSTLDTIKTTLETLAADQDYPMSGGVYYGVCNAQSLAEWNYFVFNRKEAALGNDHRLTSYYEVHIVHEDYVLEGYEITVKNALEQSIGRLVLDAVDYAYTTKGDTQVVVEICNLTFKRARKVGNG